MSILHSQLALYGAIDELVLQARTEDQSAADRELLAVAARLLPGSTGFGEAGWHRELERFFVSLGPPDASPVTFPTLQQAVSELQAVSSRTEPRATARFDGSTIAEPNLPTPDPTQYRNPDLAGGFESRTFYDPAYDSALARAGYAAFVLARLADIVGWDRLSVPPEDLDAVLAGSLGVFEANTDIAEQQNTASRLLASLNTVNSRSDWTARLEDVGADPRFITASKPCFGTLQLVGSRYCSTVVTDITDPDLSVSDVERIIDPMNWSICSKFFCTMSANDPPRNEQRWSRIRERIGAECSEYGLSTDLVFYKGRQSDGTIYINYDIDPERNGDDPYVEVDNGYLWISPLTPNQPGAPGVRVRTSKQEHVQGLSPSATAALACVMGWGDAGRDMIAGTARRLIEAEAAGRPFHPLEQFVESRLQDTN